MTARRATIPREGIQPPHEGIQPTREYACPQGDHGNVPVGAAKKYGAGAMKALMATGCGFPEAADLLRRSESDFSIADDPDTKDMVHGLLVPMLQDRNRMDTKRQKGWPVGQELRGLLTAVAKVAGQEATMRAFGRLKRVFLGREAADFSLADYGLKGPLLDRHLPPNIIASSISLIGRRDITTIPAGWIASSVIVMYGCTSFRTIQADAWDMPSGLMEDRLRLMGCIAWDGRLLDECVITSLQTDEFPDGIDANIYRKLWEARAAKVRPKPPLPDPANTYRALNGTGVPFRDALRQMAATICDQEGGTPESRALAGRLLAMADTADRLRADFDPKRYVKLREEDRFWEGGSEQAEARGLETLAELGRWTTNRALEALGLPLDAPAKSRRPPEWMMR
jgi:hypothetical protein